MKKIKPAVFIVGCFVCCSINLHAQLTASAGSDTVLCATGNIILGGNPTASGGVPPYSYTWTPSIGLVHPDSANPVANITASITFDVTVTDNVGTTASASITINQGLVYASIATPAMLTCTQTADTLTASSGQTGLNFLWGDGTSGATDIVYYPGTYVVTASNPSNGCQTTDTAIVVSNNAPPMIINGVVTNVTCWGDSSGGITINMTGGTPSFHYMWSNSDTTSNISGLVTDTFSITVTDYINCSISAYYYVTAPTPLVLQGVSSSQNLPDTITFTPAGGITPYTCSLDSNGIIVNCGPPVIANNATVYVETITDANGCIVKDTAVAGCFNQCVWPGDANYDGIVDNNDLLPIGLAYDSTGFVRPNATLNYIPQYCQNWTDSLQDSINFKHIDCDGNGIIDANDTLAITLNFGLINPRSGGVTMPKSGAPEIVPLVNPDTVSNNGVLNVRLMLGSLAVPANNVYGIAFTLNYDPAVVDSNQTAITFGSSWLGGIYDAISIAKDFKQLGLLKCALTRIDHAGRSGYGAIGNATFVINTDNINLNPYAYYGMYLFISDVKMIDSAGNVLPVNAASDSVFVAGSLTGIGQSGNLNPAIRMYPNPAGNSVQISSLGTDIGEIRIINTLGQTVLRQIENFRNHAQLNISSLDSGIYTVQVFTDKGMATERLVISK